MNKKVYCVVCKKKVDSTGKIVKDLKHGHDRFRGVCPKCKNQVSQFV